MKVYPAAAWLVRQTTELHIVAQVPNETQPLGIGFNKDNLGLLKAVNAALASITLDGAYTRLARKWGIP
jgi:ABC-type amino acid transport substrate-binding protein